MSLTTRFLRKPLQANLAEPESQPELAAAVSSRGGPGKHKSGSATGGGSGGSDRFAMIPPSGASEAWVETMLATEEGLTIQARGRGGAHFRLLRGYLLPFKNAPRVLAERDGTSSRGPFHVRFHSIAVV